MKKSVCAVLDAAAECYSNPFFSANKAVGIRDFHYACQDKSTSLGRNPEDYSLWYLGEFDDVLCTFDLLPAPEKIAVGFTPKE